MAALAFVRKGLTVTYDLYDVPNPTYDTTIAPLRRQIREDIQNLRAAGAEFVVFLMHSGGQYNPWPDALTLRIASFVREAGADAIIGHHPHVIHPCKINHGCPIAYSLGNFTFTPSSDLPKPELRPDCSILLTLDIQRIHGRVELKEMAFSVHRSVASPGKPSMVWPLFDAHAACADVAERKRIVADNAYCVNKFLGQPQDTPVPFLSEYTWPVCK